MSMFKSFRLLEEYLRTKLPFLEIINEYNAYIDGKISLDDISPLSFEELHELKKGSSK